MSDDLVGRLRSEVLIANGYGWPDEAQLVREAAAEIERLRAALRECGADYISPPCTVTQGAAHVAAEFQRRMEIAHAALENT